MGFEMDLRELTEGRGGGPRARHRLVEGKPGLDDAGRHPALPTGDPSLTAELHRAADGSRFVAFAGRSATSPQILPRPLRLTGLDPTARYEMRLANPRDARPRAAAPWRFKAGLLALSGPR